MSKKNISQVVGKFIDEMGVKRINIVGGEPFICDNIAFALEQMIDRKNIEVEMVTNGSIDNHGILDLLKKVNLALFKVSIHTINEKKFDWFTTTEKLFPKVLNNIKQFLKTLPFGINITAMKMNHREIPNMISFFAKMGVKNFWISQLTPSGNALNIMTKSQLSKEEIIQLGKIIKERFRESDVKIRYDNQTICKFGTFLSINSQGDVFPCAALVSYPEQKIGTIYSSNQEITTNIKKKLISKKRLCFVKQIFRN
ncbi:radical SAM protein [Candidatus Parcubacteria bacterium]|nr:radical SAM protein [Candidatus Parcubacteria bacterium]